MSLIIILVAYIFYRIIKWQRALAKEREIEHEAKVAEQRAIMRQLEQCISTSNQCAANLPKLVKESERFLNIAESEFDEGAFAPFWDAIENAAIRLGQFENNIRTITYNASEFKRIGSNAENPPDFQISDRGLPDASRNALRMQDIVRRAQKNFQFATIYEQRKTNQLLVSGFRTLGEVLNNIGDRLETSLDTFSTAVRELHVTQQSALSELEKSAEHQEKTREILTDMQSRRKPRQ